MAKKAAPLFGKAPMKTGKLPPPPPPAPTKPGKKPLPPFLRRGK